MPDHAMQYGLIQGYAYYLVYGVSMVAAGFITDKYKLNRVYVVAIGSGLTGVALVIEVSHLLRLSSLHSGQPCNGAHFSHVSGRTDAWL